MIELVKEHLTRQMDVISLKSLDRKITVIGAGAIGSYTIWALAKMGFEDITVYDFDEVDVVNLNSQIYGPGHIGSKKVESLQSIIETFTGVKINIVSEKYDGQVFNDIVICAVDNMKTRKEIYEAHKAKGIFTNLLIDPRMAIEFAHIQAFNPFAPDKQKRYEKTLFEDKDGVQERCTGKSTVYTAQLIGATIAKIVKDFSNGKNYYKYVLWDIGNNEITESDLEIIELAEKVAS